MIEEKVVFRADGNKQMGYGHIIRSLALAGMLSPEFESTLAVTNPDSFIIEQAKLEHIRITAIQDETAFLNMLNKNQIVVLDGYQFLTPYMNQVAERDVKLACIDDLHDKFFPADLIINHSPVANKQQYQALPHTLFALGFDYALLRKPFLNAAGQQQTKQTNGKVLIIMGGADPLRLTETFLQITSQKQSFTSVSAVVGAADYTNYAGSHSGADFHHSLSAEEMCNLMLKHEYIICPASSVCMEALALERKVFAGYYAENQKEFYTYLHQNSLVHGLGDFRLMNPEDVSILASLNSNEKKLIDGNQGKRFKEIFQKISD